MLGITIFMLYEMERHKYTTKTKPQMFGYGIFLSFALN